MDWVTAELVEFLEKDPTSGWANFRKIYLKLVCDGLAPNFLSTFSSPQLALSPSGCVRKWKLPRTSSASVDDCDQQPVSVKLGCTDWRERVQAVRSKKNKQGCVTHSLLHLSERLYLQRSWNASANPSSNHPFPPLLFLLQGTYIILPLIPKRCSWHHQLGVISARSFISLCTFTPVQLSPCEDPYPNP